MKQIFAYFLMIICGSAYARTPEQALLQKARATVRVSLLRTFCGPVYLIDRTAIENVRYSMFQSGVDRFGEAAMRRAMAGVEEEFLREMRAGGAAKWCPEQRSHYRKLGLPGLIGEELTQ